MGDKRVENTDAGEEMPPGNAALADTANEGLAVSVRALRGLASAAAAAGKEEGAETRGGEVSGERATVTEEANRGRRRGSCGERSEAAAGEKGNGGTARGSGWADEVRRDDQASGPVVLPDGE